MSARTEPRADSHPNRTQRASAIVWSNSMSLAREPGRDDVLLVMLVWTRSGMAYSQAEVASRLGFLVSVS
jgi:hypothetical protein